MTYNVPWHEKTSRKNQVSFLKNLNMCVFKREVIDIRNRNRKTNKYKGKGEQVSGQKCGQDGGVKRT